MIDILSIPYDKLAALPPLQDEPGFRHKQLFHWLHKQGCRDFSQMNNLPQSLRDKLADSCTITRLVPLQKLVSQLDGTHKFLYELPDRQTVETVLMQYEHGVSACLSTQVGCLMGCAFCASTQAGFIRNLTAAEMLEQMLESERQSGLIVHSVVLMGIGEPLLNLQNLLDFFALLSHKEGRDFSLRRLSLSTCGLIPEIEELMQHRLPLTLSVSLHAPDDETRDRIMPVNRRYPVKELVAATKRYAETTKRRVSYEYALIQDVNDRDRDAKALASLLRGSLAHVNLIPLNDVPGTGLAASSRERVRAFHETLLREGINATVRRTLGADVMAACGQLRVHTQGKGVIGC